ncbi:Hypothetical predicted protein, partial [Pelobates cultripes]
NAALLEPYSAVKVFVDTLISNPLSVLSASTLQFRKSMAQITATLRSNDLSYRWGYLAKLLIQKQGVIHAVATQKKGLLTLKDWDVPLADP